MPKDYLPLDRLLVLGTQTHSEQAAKNVVASALLCWTIPAWRDTLTHMIGILIVLLIVFAGWAGNRVTNSINNQN